MATESKQFPFFLQAAIEHAEKLEALGPIPEARMLARTMRDYEAVFRAWQDLPERPPNSQLVISDFLTASRVVLEFLAGS